MQNDLSAHYRLNQDLNDASPGYATHVKDGTVLANGGAGWKPIGSSNAPFTGHFNGNGYITDDLYINRPGEDELGLFGHIGAGGSIKTIGVSITIDNGAGGAGGNTQVGGVAGVNAGNIQETYSLGDVIGISTVGGLVGENTGTVRDSYSMVATTGDVVGGLVGKNTGTVDKSYSVGFVTPPGGKRDTFGGLVADNTGGTVTASYWDQETTGTGGTGSKETARMKMRQTFPTWDFVSIWAIEKGASASYPYLRNATQAPIPGLVGLSEYFGGGDGSVDAPFEIETWTHLHNIRQAPDKQFRLANDLLPSTEGYTTYVADENGLVDDGKGWTPIASFSGRLTGARPDGVFKIKGLKINRGQSNVGLFSVLEPTAVIEDLLLTEASITGQSSSGIVAGTSKGLLLRVGGGGSVNVNSAGGGLLGTMSADPAQAESPAVERSFAHVDVTAAGDTAGGLVGFVAGINGGSFVLDSYSIGDVTATDQVGGLIGVSDGIVRRTYAAGQVTATDNTASKVGGLIGRPINTTNVTDSFYDTEATGQAYDPATDVGIGQPSASMKNVAIFEDAGWNLTATTGVWAIEQGDRLSYPYLQGIGYDSPGTTPEVQPIPGLVALPGSPTGANASPADGEATVAWTAPNNDGGSTITGYRVTSTPESLTCATTGSVSCTVTGLTNGTAYAFSVIATNSVGDSPPSELTEAVTPLMAFDGLMYDVIENTMTVEVTGRAPGSAATSVLIPETISMDAGDYAVVRVKDHAFDAAKNNESQSLKRSKDALPGAKKTASNAVVELALSSSIQEVGAQAFAGNALTDLTIPESITTIKQGAFKNNALEQVSFKGPFGDFDLAMFEGNESLTTITYDCTNTIGWPKTFNTGSASIKAVPSGCTESSVTPRQTSTGPETSTTIHPVPVGDERMWWFLVLTLMAMGGLALRR